MPDQTQRNRDTVLEYLELFRTWDPGKYEPFLTDDPVYRVGETVHRGKEGFARVARYGAELYPNGMSPEIQGVIADGDSVAVRMVMRAVTNKGVDYENTYLLWFDLDGGRIAAQWEIMDFRVTAEKFAPPSSRSG